MNDDERRTYIRHPVDVPVRIFPQQNASAMPVQMSDVGKGGIAFRTDSAMEKGTFLMVAIPHVLPPFEESCTVCWCEPQDDGFEIGIRFLDQQGMFKARMVEQVCYIEEYRRQQMDDGRELSLEESAREWIEKNAADFWLT
ncbi:MAG: PilZ domain-containing protein [Mariprofundus sp.]|nr:PilZ domain-containing protein [Mariprofundus sp.]